MGDSRGESKKTKSNGTKVLETRTIFPIIYQPTCNPKAKAKAKAQQAAIGRNGMGANCTGSDWRAVTVGRRNEAGSLQMPLA